ncbi:MAG: bifunctional DNA primase/polymerase [Lentilactobacillus diolivorans]|uniref:bifunctional DNA primase/polymerase n=1 Tax=Lentilactobacillus diolivorans TaxID=179838 RepID=UPI0039EC8F81
MITVNELTRHAVELANQGLQIFPLQANSKRPITAHGYLDASDDVNQIEAWFDNDWHYNIGLQLADTGIVVVDIDHHTQTQVDGRTVLKQWQAKGMTLIPQYAEQTPHGLHYFFKSHQPLSDKVIVPGVEVKTKQIMIAPSQLDGKTYQMIKGTGLSHLSLLPEWLINLLTNQQTAHTTLQHRFLYKTWMGKMLDQLVTGTEQGQRNIYLTSLLGKLLHTGCDGDTAYSLLFFANDHLNPPLPDREVNTIYKSVLRRSLK